MTLATMADRSLPLAERVRLAMLDWDMTAATEAHREALVADVAAAERLAEAWYAVSQLADKDDDTPGFLSVWRETLDKRTAALAAYRARMQGVNRG